jgi:hypothetical protein
MLAEAFADAWSRRLRRVRFLGSLRGKVSFPWANECVTCGGAPHRVFVLDGVDGTAVSTACRDCAEKFGELTKNVKVLPDWSYCR